MDQRRRAVKRMVSTAAGYFFSSENLCEILTLLQVNVFVLLVKLFILPQTEKSA